MPIAGHLARLKSRALGAHPRPNESMLLSGKRAPGEASSFSCTEFQRPNSDFVPILALLYKYTLRPRFQVVCADLRLSPTTIVPPCHEVGSPQEA